MQHRLVVPLASTGFCGLSALPALGRLPQRALRVALRQIEERGEKYVVGARPAAPDVWQRSGHAEPAPAAASGVRALSGVQRQPPVKS